MIGRTGTDAEVPIFWPPIVKSQIIGKTLMLGKIVGRKRGRQQRMRWLVGINDSMDMSFHKLLEIMKDREAWHTVVQGIIKRQIQLSN